MLRYLKTDPNPTITTERWTEATKTALSEATIEAILGGATSITVTYLLAGLCFEEDSRAQRVGDLKANASYLRWLTGLSQLPRRQVAIAEFQPEMDADATKAISFAQAEADRDGEYWIDSDHLLRGLLRFNNDASFSLLKTDLTLHSARRRSKVDRKKYPHRNHFDRNVLNYQLLRKFTLWVSPLLSAASYFYILFQVFGLELPFKIR